MYKTFFYVFLYFLGIVISFFKFPNIKYHNVVESDAVEILQTIRDGLTMGLTPNMLSYNIYEVEDEDESEDMDEE